MDENQRRVPIVCPTCHLESIAELPLFATFEALEQSCPVLLKASCHGLVWPASEVEREQLRQYLDAGSVSTLTGDLKSSNS